MSDPLLSTGVSLSLAVTQHEMESDDVLAVLRCLARKACSPVVQECLKSAHGEIAHLTGAEGDSHTEDWENVEMEDEDHVFSLNEEERDVA